MTLADNIGCPRCARRSGGFTLIEIIVSVLIISLLIGLLITGVRVAATTARDQALRATVRTLGLAVRQFESQFGYPPPLVHDGEMMSSPLPTEPGGATVPDAPVYDLGGGAGLRRPAAFQGAEGDLFLRGYDPSSGVRYPFDTSTGLQGVADERYSKFSLPYYVIGVLGANVDGVDGPGFNEPRRTGGFQLANGTPRYESFFDLGRASAVTLEGEYFDLLEYRENDRSVGFIPNPGVSGQVASVVTRDDQALVDGNGRAFRYYRWEPGDPNAGRGQAEIASVVDMNIPSVLLNPVLAAQAYQQATGGSPVTVDPTEGNAALRSARWAIVGAGANGVFGTEEIGELREILNIRDADELEVRRIAREDNLVEVGG